MNSITLNNTWAIFCVFSDKRIAKNEKKLEAVIQILLKFGIEGIVIVDNSPNNLNKSLKFFSDLSGKVSIIKGSNEFAEFSAWVEGIKEVDTTHKGKSYILFNDTLFSHFKLFFWKIVNFINQIEKHSSITLPIQLGERVNLPFESEVLGLAHRHFIRSALFYLNNSAAQLFINSCNSVFRQAEKAFQSSSSFNILGHFFNESGSYHVGRWLFSGGWYASTSFEKFDKTLLKFKITAIACEHMISASCMQKGGDAIDTNIQNNFKVKEQLKLFRETFFKYPKFVYSMHRKLRN